jgi:ribosomal protein S18 acetylase RimI-like enzyme
LTRHPERVTDIRGATSDDAEACVDIVRRLPEYFTPDTHEDVRRGISSERAWVAIEGGVVTGFVLVVIRFPRAAEITFAAVTPDRQGTGLGTRLVQHALAVLEGEGVAVVEVKTLDASSNYEPYVSTRAFWERRGFVQIDCIDPLPGWRPGNPSAIYVAALRPTA